MSTQGTKHWLEVLKYIEEKQKASKRLADRLEQIEPDPETGTFALTADEVETMQGLCWGVLADSYEHEKFIKARIEYESRRHKTFAERADAVYDALEFGAHGDLRPFDAALRYVLILNARDDDYDPSRGAVLESDTRKEVAAKKREAVEALSAEACVSYATMRKRIQRGLADDSVGGWQYWKIGNHSLNPPEY